MNEERGMTEAEIKDALSNMEKLLAEIKAGRNLPHQERVEHANRALAKFLDRVGELRPQHRKYLGH